MQFRYARHTIDLEKLANFYTSVLNFEVLGKFEDHAGYAGVFLGIKDENWHLEFTQNGDDVQSKRGEDDALVFYPKTKRSYDEILKKVKQLNLPLLETKNPYWNDHGICFLDPDCFRIIISAEKTET